MNENLEPEYRNVGRNDPCPCGSGKKYKKCCLLLTQQKAQQSQEPETLSDKYFSVREYIKHAGYPLLNFDFFLLELLNIIGGTLQYYQKLPASDMNHVLIKLLKEARDFYSTCNSCENQCLEEPMENVNFKSLLDKGLKIEQFPGPMQQRIRLNFFYFEFLIMLVGKLVEELRSYLPEGEPEDIGSVIHNTLFEFVSEECWEHCGNSCITNHDQNSYCNFCTFGMENLPCPKNGEIHYEEIQATEKDMKH